MDDIDALRAQLRWAGRRAVADGLAVGSGGNVSARHRDGGFVVTTAGAWLDELGDDEFVVVPAGGPAPASASSEWQVHAAAYEARDDALVVLHLHPQTAVLLDALGHRLRRVTTDHAFHVRQVRATPFRIPGTAAVATAVGEALRDCDVVVLRHHGCVVVGATVREAYARAINLEQAAVTTWRGLALGVDPPEVAAELLERLDRI